MRCTSPRRHGAHRAGSLVWAGLSLCLLAASLTTRAEGQAEPPSASAQREATGSAQRQREQAAKAAFQAGVQAAEAGDHARARELFLQSRALVVKASTLLNLAVVDLKLGRADEALEALDALDASAPEPGRLRERGKELRREAEAMRLKTVAPAEASPAPAPLARAAPPPASAPAPAVTQPQPVAAAPARAALGAPRALLIAGGVLSAAAIGGALWWSDRSRALDACLNDDALQCLEREEIELQQRAAMGLTLALGAAGVGLLTGGAIWLAQRKHDQRTRTYVSAWLFKGSAGAALRTTF